MEIENGVLLSTSYDDLVDGKLIIPKEVKKISKNAFDRLKTKETYTDGITRTEKLYNGYKDEYVYDTYYYINKCHVSGGYSRSGKEFWLREIEIPDTVEGIEQGTFTDLSGLFKFTLPSHLVDDVMQDYLNSKIVYERGDEPWPFGHEQRDMSNWTSDAKEKADFHQTLIEALENVFKRKSSRIAEAVLGKVCIAKTDDGNTVRTAQVHPQMGLHCLDPISYGIPDEFTKGYLIVPEKFKEQIEKERPDVVVIAKENYCGEIDEEKIALSEPEIEGAKFAGNSSLKKIVLKEGTKKIGKYAFADCENLEEIEIADGIEEIQDYAFANCDKLKEIYLPSTLTKVGQAAFKGCSKLEEITIPENIKVLDVSIFEECENLHTIYLPEGVKIIGENAFKGCKNLAFIEISNNTEDKQPGGLPKALKKIGKSAFEDCTQLISIDMDDKITEIGECAFKNCESLTSVHISKRVKEIKFDTFSGCKSIVSVEIPEDVTKIGENAFLGNESVMNLVINSGTSAIGKSAFEGCKNLTNLTIPKSVKTVGEDAFKDCTELINVEIDSGIIPGIEKAFPGCTTDILFSKETKKNKIVHIQDGVNVNIEAEKQMKDMNNKAIEEAQERRSILEEEEKKHRAEIERKKADEEKYAASKLYGEVVNGRMRGKKNADGVFEMISEGRVKKEKIGLSDIVRGVFGHKQRKKNISIQKIDKAVKNRRRYGKITSAIYLVYVN